MHVTFFGAASGVARQEHEPFVKNGSQKRDEESLQEEVGNNKEISAAAAR